MNGQIMILAIIFLTVVLILTAATYPRIREFLQFSSNSILREQATNLAEAGIDNAVWQLNQTAGAYTGETNTAVGTTGTFTVTIQSKSSSLVTITSTGYIPSNNNPKAKRTIKVDALISDQAISFRYAVQTGFGGVSMQNSAEIHGTVYSNGNITGQNASVIEGDAYAVGTISTPPIVTGTKYPSSSPVPMPSVDYLYWKDAAAAGGTTTCSPTCEINNSSTIGPQKYVGNLLLQNNAIVTMNGPVHVTGNFEVKNLAQLNLASSFGSNGSVLITDGTVTVQNNGGLNPTNSNPKGYILVVTTSTSNQAVVIKNHGATAIFYALDGTAELAERAGVSSLVANALTMQNNAELNYDLGLASANFSAGPGGSWQIKKGTYRFTIIP